MSTAQGKSRKQHQSVPKALHEILILGTELINRDRKRSVDGEGCGSVSALWELSRVLAKRPKELLAPIITLCKHLPAIYLLKHSLNTIQLILTAVQGHCSELPLCQLLKGMTIILTHHMVIKE